MQLSSISQILTEDDAEVSSLEDNTCTPKDSPLSSFLVTRSRNMVELYHIPGNTEIPMVRGSYTQKEYKSGVPSQHTQQAETSYVFIEMDFQNDDLEKGDIKSDKGVYRYWSTIP